MTDRASDIGRLVAKRRRQLSLTQEELGELAGCSTRFVHTVENGKPSIRLNKLLEVLDVLGLAMNIGERPD
jgi:HTH-type transcriptional regulator/antitoxin HipB